MYWNEPSTYKVLGRNPNLTYTRKRKYKDLPIYPHKGPLITQYLDVIRGTLNKALHEFPEVVVYRFDLRFPYWINMDDVGELPSDLITRFWASVWSQLQSCVGRLHRDGYEATLSRLRNIWCKELPATDRTQHYHAALILDADLFDCVCQSMHSNVFENIVQEAWTRIIGVEVYEAPRAVWIPDNNIYRVYRGDLKSYVDVFRRLSYLAKSSTKLFHDGSQWFGATRR